MKPYHPPLFLLISCLFPLAALADIGLLHSEHASGGACNGAIHLEASGSAGPFVISLNGVQVAEGVNGYYELADLCPGEYTIIVVNAYRCETTLEVTIENCSPISIEGLAGGITLPSGCGISDGSFSFAHGTTVVGGLGPYDIRLEDKDGREIPRTAQGGWKGLAAGYYTFYITDALGCAGEVEMALEGDHIEVLYGAEPECENSENGSIWVQAYNWANPDGFENEAYTYQWSTGQTFETNEDVLLENLSAGVYTVTVTSQDEECTYVQSIAVEGLVSESPLTINATLSNTCPHQITGRIELEIKGGVPRPAPAHFPYQVEWSDGVIFQSTRAQLTAGIYSVSVTDYCGNIVIETFEITEFPDIVVSNVEVEHLCPEDNGGAVNLSLSGDGPFITQWFVNGTDWPNVFSNSEDLLNAPAGDYRLRVRYHN